MAVNNIIKRIQNIMRQDAGINGDAQRIEQMTWMFFLKVYDTQEETWEWKDEKYKSIIPEDLRWRNWAIDKKDGEALTGEALLSFVNEKLFPTLKNLPIDANTPRAKSIVQETFADLNQYMKNGTLLRQVVNIVNEIEFDDADDRHTFGDIYEDASEKTYLCSETHPQRKKTSACMVLGGSVCVDSVGISGLRLDRTTSGRKILVRGQRFSSD